MQSLKPAAINYNKARAAIRERRGLPKASANQKFQRDHDSKNHNSSYMSPGAAFLQLFMIDHG
jgi:hypothetical protein